MTAVQALMNTRVYVHMAAPEWKDGKQQRKPLRGGSFVFERMSPADVWNLIASAARDQLFRVSPVPRKFTETE